MINSTGKGRLSLPLGNLRRLTRKGWAFELNLEGRVKRDGGKNVMQREAQ